MYTITLIDVDLLGSLNQYYIMSTIARQPYKNGFYFNRHITAAIFKVEGNIINGYATGMKLDYPDEEKTICPPGSWTLGDFGPAKEEVTKAAGGIKNYNVQIIAMSGIVKIPTSF